MTTPGSGLPESRHQRVKHLFLAALDVPRTKRAAFLAGNCGDDDALRREVLELFLLHGEQDSVLDAPLDGMQALKDLGTPAEGRVGPYRLIRELGRGGMGVVHLAERDGRFAAVKLLATGSVSPEVRERFRLEADILRRLDHPGIARVLDAGELTGPGGMAQPWLAMEYIDGRPLLEHADHAGLPVRARLELLAAVCDAVQHAHAHDVVHRDLKPSNILVRADGRPIVLDFGVARLTTGEERPTELATRTGQLVGTPQYMSPEQVQAEPLSVGPRSDVYSLGVIAYELLAGRLPYLASSVSLHRAVVTILTVEPPSLGEVVPEHRGPLERIVSTALEKAPEHRYANAGELADDLRRQLEGRTIRAHGPSLGRRIQRWSRGRRRMVASLAAAAGAILLVAAWVLGGGQGVPRARVLANYREAEGLLLQSVPLLYEGERTPERLQQAIDRYTRARQLIEQVPRLPHHDPLMRQLEKELGTAQFLLGERTWDIAPTRMAVTTLRHAQRVPLDTLPGWRKSIQVPELTLLEVPNTTILGLLCDAQITLNRQWGEPTAIELAEAIARESMAENLRRHGPPPPIESVPEVDLPLDPYGYCYNALTQVLTDRARFTASAARAREAVQWSDSAMTRRMAFRQNWPALGSLLYERGRAFHTLGVMARSQAALDSSERYLIACGDFRGPDRPWVFAETREERALLALDRTRLGLDSTRAIASLHAAHAGLDSALLVLRGGGWAPATTAALHALDAEVLAEWAVRTRRPELLDSAAARVQSALPFLPTTALPRRAGLAWVAAAVVERARFEMTRDPARLAAAFNALDRATIISSQHDDSTLIHRLDIEHQVLASIAAHRPTR